MIPEECGERRLLRHARQTLASGVYAGMHSVRDSWLIWRKAGGGTEARNAQS